MAITTFSGPLLTFGQSPYNPLEYNPELGPSAFYAGAGILDPRLPYTYIAGQNFGAFTGMFYGFDNITTLNIVPYTVSSAAIVASANPTSATLTLVSSASATTGVSIVSQIVRADTGAVDTNGGAGFVALDAYATVTGYVSNGTSGVAGNTLIVSTAGNGPLAIGMVISGTGIPSGTTITGFGPTVGATLSNGGAGTGFTGSYTVSGNSFTAGTSGSQITVTASLNNAIDAVLSNAIPQGQAGTLNLWNPQAVLGRALTYTAATAGTYTTITCAGYDVYGFPMTETATLSAGSTVTGKKAFKYIKSVTLSGGTADTTHAYSVGTSALVGLPIRADSSGELTAAAGASKTLLQPVTNFTGFTAADNTYPTATTGDVRGTIDLSNGTGVNLTPSTGTNRYVVRQSPQPYNVSSSAGLFGNTQYANF
jgi:hypothetical protein